MFFDGWEQLGRVAVVGGLAYFGLILLLRVSGKRTLAKMNAFDMVVTVALGSTLATALLSASVSLLEALVAFATLVGLQMAVAWSSARSARVREIVKSEPTLLVHRGQLLRGAIRRERLSETEVFQAVRNAGRSDLAGVAAVVLETDGSLSVVVEQGDGRAMAPVEGPGG